MIAVIFEVWPKPEHQQAYFDFAATLRRELDRIDGFISVERFHSLTDTGKFLSLSFFRDEEAVRQWRLQTQHHQAQEVGKNNLFADYRLRVAHVLRDYGKNDRADAPQG